MWHVPLIVGLLIVWGEVVRLAVEHNRLPVRELVKRRRELRRDLHRKRFGSVELAGRIDELNRLLGDQG